MPKKIIAALVCVIMVLTTVTPDCVQAVENNEMTMKSEQGGSQYKYQVIDDFVLRNPGARLNTMKDSKGVQQNFTYNKITNMNSMTAQLQIGYKCSVSTNKDTYFQIQLYKDNGYGYVTCVFVGGADLNGVTSKNWLLNYERESFKNQPYIYVFLGLATSSSANSYSTYQAFKIKNPDYTAGGNVVKGSYAIISNDSVAGENTQYTGSFSTNSLVQSREQQEQLKLEDYKTDVIIPFDSKKNQTNLLQNKQRDGAQQQKVYAVGSKKAFNVQNLQNGNYSSINTELMYSGKKADVWVYNNQITKSQAEAMGKEFDNKINSVVTDNFGSPSDIDNNGKVNILCYDIQDGFSGNSSYVAGYFSPADLHNVAHSNKCEMFYVDTYPTMGTGAKKDPSKAYSTLAHEYQHMVNYNENVIKGKQTEMAVWMNEGMSMAAEQIYLGKSLDSRINYYNTSSSIKSGHSLLYWDNSGDTLANYSLSYLFMQYLKIQSGKGNKIFKELMSLSNNNYKDVETLVKKYINKNMSFSKFMIEFRAALLLKQKTGLRGFKGDSGFNSVKTQLYTGGGKDIRGGGAIIKNISNGGIKVASNRGKNITYTIINPKSNTKPVIKGASNKTIYVGQKIDAKKGISASDKEDGNLTSKIKVSGSVNTKKAANYYVTYSVTDSDHNTVSKKVKITVLNKFKTFTVNSVDRKQGYITGKGVYKATVQAYVNGKKIGKSVTVNKKGQYKLNIPKQAAGKKIVVKMTKSWYKTTEKTVKVLNTFGTFTMNKVSTKTTKVTGKGLKGATIKVYVNGKKTGKTVKVGSNGRYSVKISKQKRGKKVEVRMVKSGYRSIQKNTKVKRS